MKFIHISDLHLGKHVNHFPMLEDQRYILGRIAEIIRAEQPDAVLITGDVFDRPVPSEEAVALYDDFCYEIAKTGAHLMVIYGNHDSAERISCNYRQLRGACMYVSPVFENAKEIVRVPLTDGYGTVDFYLIPFVRPYEVRAVYPEAEIESAEDAIREVIAHLNLDPAHRSVALAHLFLQNAITSEDSETAFVGGEEAVSAEVFAGFDYAALGHLHGPQKVGAENIRYAGSPIKYSFSELKQKKSVTVVEMKEKGNTAIRQIPLVPLHDMGELTGTFEEITHRAAPRDLYYRATLSDEQEIPNAADRLREFYPNLMILDYARRASQEENGMPEWDGAQKQDMMGVFSELFRKVNAREMTEEQAELVKKLIAEIEGGRA